MPLQVTGRHREVTPEDRDYLQKKLPRLERLCERIDELEVVFILEKKSHVVEINLRSGPIRVFTKASGATSAAAIDKAIDRVQAQVTRAREKKFGNKIHATETIRAVDESLEGNPEEGPDETED